MEEQVVFSDGQSLFAKFTTFDLINNHEQGVDQQISQLDASVFRNNSIETLSQQYASSFSLNAPELHVDKIYTEKSDTTIDVSHNPLYAHSDYGPRRVDGIKITFHIPFTGDSKLFGCKPSHFTLSPPRADISTSEVLMSYKAVPQSAHKIKDRFESEKKELISFLEWMTSDFSNFNSKLPTLVSQKLSARYEKIKTAENVLDDLGYPTKPNDSEDSRQYAVSVPRKKLSDPVIEVGARGKLDRQPIMENRDYDLINQVIHDMGMSMESSPKAYKSMEEEDLRQHLLDGLNTHFELAKGETFNSSGKPDIIIYHDKKIIFVAECKIWKGKSACMEAVKQLFGYTTWRDTKTALVIFCRNKQFQSVLDQMPELVKQHEYYDGNYNKRDKSMFSCVMKHNRDEDRKIDLTLHIFDLYTDK